MLRTDGTVLLSVGVVVQLCAVLAHQGLQRFTGKCRQLADGLHAVLPQQLLGGASHPQQVAHRQRPDDALPVVPVDDGGGVGLFVVAAQLGEDLVEADAHGDGQPQLLPQTLAQLVGDGFAVAAEQVHAAGNVQPAFVDAEGLHQISVLAVDGVDLLAVLPVQAVVGRQGNEVGRLLSGLPDGLRRFHTQLLGGLVFGQYDAVAGFRVAAHRHGNVPQRRIAQKLHRREKAVQIAMQDHPIRHDSPSSR